jgi:carboxyl-terminal processing protease
VAKYFTPSGRNIQKPYKQVENYEEEVYDRYKNGEFFNETNQVSYDTVVYLTKKGRKVKGGGGIYPDFFVALDTNYDFNSLAALRSFVPEFVYSRYNNFSHLTQYKSINEFQKSYEVSPSLLNEFFQYAKNNGAKYNVNTKSSYEMKLKNNLKAFIAKQYFKSEGFQKIVNDTDPMILRSKQYFTTSK